MMDVMGFLKKVFMAEGKKSQKGANQTSPSLLKTRFIERLEILLCGCVVSFPCKRACLLPRSSFWRCGPAVIAGAMGEASLMQYNH